MHFIKKDIYGWKLLRKPNTIIGGVASTITNKNLLAEKLGISSSIIRNFRIVNQDVQAYIDQSYAMKNNMFFNDSQITFFDDIQGRIISRSGSNNFRNCTSLKYLNLPNFSWQSGSYANMYTIAGNTAMTSLKMENCLYMPENNSINQLPLLNELHTPNIRSVGVAAVNGNLSSLTLWDIKKCKFFGNADGSGMRPIITYPIGMSINVNAALLTANAGSPNAHLIWYKGNRSAVVNFYDDNGNYVSTL